MNKYIVVLKLYNHKIIHEYVSAKNEIEARQKAFKYAIPLYKKARPEYLGVQFFYKMRWTGNQWV
jgi:hypothetical protein